MFDQAMEDFMAQHRHSPAGKSTGQDVYSKGSNHLHLGADISVHKAIKSAINCEKNF
jgi:hypothetical protein